MYQLLNQLPSYREKELLKILEIKELMKKFMDLLPLTRVFIQHHIQNLKSQMPRTDI